jgi:aldose 1-epimerase
VSAPEALALQAFGQKAVLWPGIGGRIAAWRTAGGWDGLAPIPTDQPLETALRQGGCYPLAPYSNRIEAARFVWGGREVRVAENPRAAPHSLHGVAWRRPFRVERAGEACARLVLEHAPDADWPWAFELAQTVRLEPGGLKVELFFLTPTARRSRSAWAFIPYFRAGRARS